MTVLIRETLQEALNDYNLDKFYCAVDHNKNLIVTSECRGPLFTCKGIKFSRAAPSQKEINAALDLLYAYLAKHKTIIDKIASLITEIDNLPDIPEDNEEYSISYYARFNTPVKPTIGYNSSYVDDLRVVVNIDGDVEKITYKPTSKNVQFEINPNELESYLDLLKDFMKKREKLKQLRDASDKLSSCSI